MGKATETVLLFIGVLIITASLTGLLMALGFDLSGQIDLFSDRVDDRDKADIDIVSETIPGIISDPFEEETTIQIQNTGKNDINERDLLIQVDGIDREIVEKRVIGSDTWGEDKVLEVTFEGLVFRGSRIKADVGPERGQSIVTTGPEDIELIYNWPVRQEDRVEAVGPLDFTTCGASGQFGPSQQDCDSEYSDTQIEDLNGVNVNDGIQEFVVPFTGVYTIETRGAAGGGADGAVVEASIPLEAGETIQILVGHQGPGSASGGGGTFVARGEDYTTAEPLVVAGGGGGDGDNGNPSRGRGSSTCSWGDGGETFSGVEVQGSCNAEGGNVFEGGNGREGGGGGGFIENGDVTGQSDLFDEARSFINGGRGNDGGRSVAPGAFGGGSHGNAGGWGQAGGGGGGYSGGAGGYRENPNYYGGGGGSFIHQSAVEAFTPEGEWEITGEEPHPAYDGPVGFSDGFNSGDGQVSINLESEAGVIDQQEIQETIQFENAIIEGNMSFVSRPGLVGNQSVEFRQSPDKYLESEANLEAVDRFGNPIGEFTDNQFAVSFTLRSADNKEESTIMSTRTETSSEGLEIYQSSTDTGLENGIGIQIGDDSSEIGIETESGITSRGVERYTININGQDADNWSIWKNGRELNTNVVENGDPSFNQHPRNLWFGRFSEGEARHMEGELSDIKFFDDNIDQEEITEDFLEREVIDTDIDVVDVNLEPQFGFEPFAATEDIVANITIENTGDEEDSDYVVSEAFEPSIGFGGNTTFETLDQNEQRTVRLNHDTSFGDIGKEDIIIFSATSEDFRKNTVDELVDPGPFLDDERADVREVEDEEDTYFGELDYNISTTVGFDFVEVEFNGIDTESDENIDEFEDGEVLRSDNFIDTDSGTRTGLEKGDFVDVEFTVQDLAGNRQVYDLVSQIESDTLDVTNVIDNNPIEGEDLELDVTVENLDRELTLTEDVTTEVELEDRTVTDTIEDVTLEPGEDRVLNYNFETVTEDRGIRNGTSEAQRESEDFQVAIQQDVFVEFFDVHDIDYQNEQIEYDFNATSRLGTIDEVVIEHRDKETGDLLDEFTRDYTDEDLVDEISEPMDISGLSDQAEDIEAEIEVLTEEGPDGDQGLGDNETIVRKVDEPFIIEVENVDNEVLTNFATELNLDYRDEFLSDFTNIAFRNIDNDERPVEYWKEPNNINEDVDARIWLNIEEIDPGEIQEIELLYGTTYQDEEYEGEAVFRHFDDFRTDTSGEWDFEQLLLDRNGGDRFIWEPDQERLRTDSSNSDFFQSYQDTDDDELLEQEGFVSEIATRTEDDDGMGPTFLPDEGRGNVIANPNFEDGTGTDADDWEQVQFANRVQTESLFGDFSMVQEDISSNFEREFSTTADVNEGEEYKFGGNYFVEPTLDDPRDYEYQFEIEWKDEDGNVIESDNLQDTFFQDIVEDFTETGEQNWDSPFWVEEGDVLVVAGGGGSPETGDDTAGGGAGGLVFVPDRDLTDDEIEVIVGEGGDGGSSIVEDGENSRFGNLVAIGGGHGADEENAGTDQRQGSDGGSGGGAGRNSDDPDDDGQGGDALQTDQEFFDDNLQDASSLSYLCGFGNSGGDNDGTGTEGAAGGGAGEPGEEVIDGNEDFKPGGDGISGVSEDDAECAYDQDYTFIDLFGTEHGAGETTNGDLFFAGGGGGSGERSSSTSDVAGGLGGGGDGTFSGGDGEDGMANTGGGGGGSDNNAGGDGGSGVVLINYDGGFDEWFESENITFVAPEGAEEVEFSVQSRRDEDAEQTDVYWDGMFIEEQTADFELFGSMISNDYEGADNNNYESFVGWDEEAFNNDGVTATEIIDYGQLVGGSEGSSIDEFLTVGMRYDGDDTIATSYEGDIQGDDYQDPNLRIDRVGLVTAANDPPAFYDWWRTRQFADEEPIADCINCDDP